MCKVLGHPCLGWIGTFIPFTTTSTPPLYQVKKQEAPKYFGLLINIIYVHILRKNQGLQIQIQHCPSYKYGV